MTEQTIADVRSRLRAEAEAHGINPRDVDVLLSDATGRSAAWLIAHGDEPLDAAAVEARFARRVRGEPLQYIRGRCDFFGREFLVDDRALIPRPETELLVEQAIKRAPRGGRVVDVGAGSGCIAVSLAIARPDLHVFAVDVSVAALAVAKANSGAACASAAGARGRPVHLAASDLLSSFRGRFDLIVSNPPYIPAADVESLAIEVRDFEPRNALTPGPHGTEAVARLFEEARGTPLIFEIGFGQEHAVREIAAAAHYAIDDVIPDLAGIPRVVVSSAHVGK